MRSPSNARNGSCLLFSVKNGIYKQNTHTHAESWAENSLFQFWLTITKAFSPFYLEKTTNYWYLGAWWAYGLVNSRARILCLRKFGVKRIPTCHQSTSLRSHMRCACALLVSAERFASLRLSFVSVFLPFYLQIFNIFRFPCFLRATEINRW